MSIEQYKSLDLEIPAFHKQLTLLKFKSMMEKVQLYYNVVANHVGVLDVSVQSLGTRVTEVESEVQALPAAIPSFEMYSGDVSLAGAESNDINQGDVLNLSITLNFNQGLIVGVYSSGSWNPNATLPMTGDVLEYKFNGVSNGASNTLNLPNYVAVSGTNHFTVQVLVDMGHQPLNSKGDNYWNRRPSTQTWLTYTASFRAASSQIPPEVDAEIDRRVDDSRQEAKDDHDDILDALDRVYNTERSPR